LHSDALELPSEADTFIEDSEESDKDETSDPQEEVTPQMLASRHERMQKDTTPPPPSATQQPFEPSLMDAAASLRNPTRNFYNTDSCH